jgi:hypothetical protein
VQQKLFLPEAAKPYSVRVALLCPDGPTGTFTHAKLGTLQ